jgi:NHL repeat
MRGALGALVVLLGSPAAAVTPLHHAHDLVAGKGDRGFRDGAFEEALFDAPCGLAADGAGRLYVADSGNNRIRVVELDRGNEVRTLAGNGTAGGTDGKLDRATFDRPTALALLPEERLAVADGAGTRLRIVDLAHGQVTTLPSPDGPYLGIWSLLWVPFESALWVSEPGMKRVRAVDPATGAASIVLENRGEIPSPGALALFKGVAYVADRGKGGLYRVKREESGVVLEGVERPERMVALTATSTMLHGVVEGKNNWARYSPYQPVALVTPWGGLVDQESAQTHPEMLPLFTLGTKPAGFVADPREEEHFFLAQPEGNRILGLRDHHFRDFNSEIADGPHGLQDYDGPLAKPPGVTRILLVGASQLRDQASGFTPAHSFTRMNTFPKQLELLLTTDAALNGAPARYEVLGLNHVVTEELLAWPAHQVPAVVHDYDIDHVFLILPLAIGIKTYFERPLTPDGIPGPALDPEYLTLPDVEKVGGLPALQRFYDLCKSKALVRTNDIHLEFATPDLLEKVPEIRKEYVELLGAGWGHLARTLASTPRKTPGAATFTLVWIPFTEAPSEAFETLLHDVAERYAIRLLDLAPEMTALRPTWYGFSELGGNYHLTEGGHRLVAHLLARELAPFVRPPVSGKDRAKGPRGAGDGKGAPPPPSSR